MAKYQIYAFTNPVPGKEDEYNHWYDDTHIPDVKRFPGVVSGSRHTLVSSKGTASKYKYLAIYDVETELDPDEFATQLLARAGTPDMFMSDAFDFTDFQMTTWKRTD